MDLMDEERREIYRAGYIQGREDAAIALRLLAGSTDSRYVKHDWLMSPDGKHKDAPEIWLSSVQAVSVARGEW